MKIKVGDTVVVTTGRKLDQNKTGKVLKTIAKDSMVVVEGVNLKKKIGRDAQGKKSLVEAEYPIHVSNVMFYDEKAKAGTRLGTSGVGKGKARVTKKSGTELK